MKVSDEVVEVAAKAIADLCGFESPSQKTDARAALEAALPLVLGEPVGWVSHHGGPNGSDEVGESKDPRASRHTALYAPKEQQP